VANNAVSIETLSGSLLLLALRAWMEKDATRDSS